MTVCREVIAECVWIPTKLRKLEGRQHLKADDLAFVHMSLRKGGDGPI